MKIKMKVTLLVALVALALGCTQETVNNPPPPDPVGEDTVVIRPAGSCVGVNNLAIQCNDESTSVPAGRLQGVSFRIEGGDGALAELLSGAPGDTVQSKPLPSGEYLVQQTVFADNGSSRSVPHNVTLIAESGAQ